MWGELCVVFSMVIVVSCSEKEDTLEQIVSVNVILNKKDIDHQDTSKNEALTEQDTVIIYDSLNQIFLNQVMCQWRG